jgi:SAM-dependent methyltransferase
VQHQLAWDVGAGTGQATVGLAPRFERVVATDLSAEQLALAPPLGNVEYRVSAAHESGLSFASVDLVTVAQALHWFDLPAFYAEVKRVLKPAGRIAVWTYGILSVEGTAPDERVQHFYRDVVGPYWPPGREHVENGYADLPFPFVELPAKRIDMTVSWDLDAFLGYVRSWSSTGRMQKQTGTDPTAQLEADLLPIWGGRQRQRAVTWPLRIRLGRS